MPKYGAALLAAEPKAKGHPSGCPFVLEARGEIDILDGRDYCRRTAKRPFWAAARVRRTSVFTAGENLGAGAALPTPSIQIPKGGSRLWRLEPKKKDMTKGHVFLFVFCCRKRCTSESLAAQRIQGLCDLYFCFSSLFLGHFRTPHIDILTNPYANR